MISLSKRDILAQSLVGSGFVWFLQRWGAWRGLMVLNYHRIGNPACTPWDHDLWSAATEEFDWQVSYLKQEFDLISPSDLEHAKAHPRGRHVLITFDDGYRDNYEAAYPVLKSHGVPATFFLATRFLDQPHISWWDEIAWMIRTTTNDFLDGPGWLAQPMLIDHLDPQLTIRRLLKIFKTLPGDRTGDFLQWLAEETGSGRCPTRLALNQWMTWDMVREMHANGMTFGAHTVNHPILGRLPIDQQRWEIQESRKRIEQELGERIRTFSYPVGGSSSCTTETMDCLRQEGFQWAFRYGVGFRSDPFENPLEIPRLAVEHTTARTMFRALTALPRLFE